MANTMENLDGNSLIGTGITITALGLSNIATEENLRILMYVVAIVAGITTICLNIKNLIKK